MKVTAAAIWSHGKRRQHPAFCTTLHILVVVSFFQTAIHAQDTCVCRATRTIRFAQTAPLTGSNAQAGTGLRDGILAAFKEFNDRNGSDDSKFRLELQTKDDKYDAELATQNVIDFAQDMDTFAIIGATGTATIETVAPVAIANDLPFLSAYGGRRLRNPFQPNVITVRSSYYDEAAGMIEFLVSQSRERIALFAQTDAFGEAVREGVLAALDSCNLYLHSEAWYTKNMNTSVFTQEANQALATMRKTSLPPNAIVIAAAYEPAAIFIRQLRAIWRDAYVVTISFTSIDALVGLLTSTNDDTELLNNLYSSQFLPNPAIANDTVVQQFRAAADQLGVSATSYLGLEGYLMGRLAIGALESIKGFNLTRQAFMDAIYRESFFSFDGFNIGPFYPSTIQNGCNQGIHGVRIAQVLPNKSLADVFTMSFTSCGYQRKIWQTLTFGQSCSFPKGQVSLCKSFRDGLLAAFKHVNDAGGIQGTTRLLLTTKDDKGDDQVALRNNREFLEDPKIFGLIGTSTLGIDDVVQLVANRSDKVMFGAFSGARSLREPFRPHIINFRVSFSDELHAIVHHCYGRKASSKVSVLYEATAYGQQQRHLVESALQEKRWVIFTEASYSNRIDIRRAVADLFAGRDAQLDVVIFIGLDDVIVDVLAEIHRRDSAVLVFGLSNTVVSSLMQMGNETMPTKVNLTNFRMTSGVPDVRQSTLEVVHQYTNALMRLDPLASVSNVGLEGFIVGQLLATSLNQILGKELTATMLQKSVYENSYFQIFGIHCGPFVRTRASSTHQQCNQCLKRVFALAVAPPSSEMEELLLRFDDSCTYNPVVNVNFELTTTRLVILLAACAGVLYTLAIGVLITIYRSSPHLKSVSIDFAVLLCFGALVCYTNIFLLYPVPNDLICTLRPWFGTIGFVAFYGPMHAKVTAVGRMVSRPSKTQKQNLHYDQVLVQVHIFEVQMLFLALFLVFLVVYTVMDGPVMVETFMTNGKRYEICSTKRNVFGTIGSILKGLVMVRGGLVCRRIVMHSRWVPSSSSASSSSPMRLPVHYDGDIKLVVVCMGNTFLLGLTLWLLQTTLNELPTLQFVGMSAVVLVNTTLAVTTLLARRVLRAVRKAPFQDYDEVSDSKRRTVASMRRSTKLSSHRNSTHRLIAYHSRGSTRKIYADQHLEPSGSTAQGNDINSRPHDALACAPTTNV